MILASLQKREQRKNQVSGQTWGANRIIQVGSGKGSVISVTSMPSLPCPSSGNVGKVNTCVENNNHTFVARIFFSSSKILPESESLDSRRPRLYSSGLWYS